VKLRNQRPFKAARTFWLGRRQPRLEDFTTGNRVSLRRACLAAFERMLECIEHAQRSVWLEMYWFSDDPLGQKFFQALTAARQRGVEVRVLYDALGSYGTNERSFAQLRASGVDVVVFNPLHPMERRFHLSKVTLRNHRKLLLVDGEVAFTGGTNLAAKWLEAEAGGEAWRDELVEVSGPVLRVLQAEFARSWKEATGVVLEFVEQQGAEPGGQRVAVLTQGVFPHRRQAQHAYIWRISAASRSIYLSHAYFVPEGRLARALARAAKRGVDVRIVCPGRSDVPVVGWASRYTWDKLLAAGVRIFEWHKSVLHSKMAVVDGEWVTVGSLNLDRFSLRNNRELNISVLDAEFGAEAEREFEADCQQSAEVDYARFKLRPWSHRLISALVYRFRTWL
jgi:cardiolipin synthase A/B